MQSEKTVFDDVARLATGAAGVVGDALKQLELRLRDHFERLLARMELSTREELEAVKAMAVAAREENEQLSARVAELEAVVNPPTAPKAPPPRRRESPARAKSAVRPKAGMRGKSTSRAKPGARPKPRTSRK